MKEKTLKALERYGIHNEQELEEAFKKQKKLDIGIFTERMKGRNETIFDRRICERNRELEASSSEASR